MKKNKTKIWHFINKNKNYWEISKTLDQNITNSKVSIETKFTIEDRLHLINTNLFAFFLKKEKLINTILIDLVLKVLEIFHCF